MDHKKNAKIDIYVDFDQEVKIFSIDSIGDLELTEVITLLKEAHVLGAKKINAKKLSLYTKLNREEVIENQLEEMRKQILLLEKELEGVN